jgi:pyruvate/2-oxoglutarate dehydrogenase complex dihydrolipoamide acyltransferase (E2) component
MNLIEEFGGYECAKAELNDPMYEDDELYTIKATGTRFFKHNLAEALLEYRRANNIFEVNDQVVLINHHNISKSLHRVLAVNTPTTIHVCPINQVSGNDMVILSFMANPYYLRHATDEEFAAGHRLESLKEVT